MRLSRRLTNIAARAHLPKRTVRLRLAALYGAMFLVSGALLLVITDLLWGSATSSNEQVNPIAFGNLLSALAVRPPASAHIPSATRVAFPRAASLTLKGKTATPAQARLFNGRLLDLRAQVRTDGLHELIFYSAIAIGIMAVVAMLLGWLMAGRILRPISTITAATKEISATNLHERLELEGPDDELKELGDTIDSLLARLEGAFEAQRQFVANASHELRTPLATMRASIDVAMAKSQSVPDETVGLTSRLGGQLDQMERLLDGLLALARAQRGPESLEAVPLHEMVGASLERHGAEISLLGLHVEDEIGAEIAISGNELLVSRMVENLIDNAVRHNVAGGSVTLRAERDGAVARLVVESGGAAVDPALVSELVRPFRRLGAERTGSENGSGLGLSIVAAVVAVHGGRIDLQAREQGGLRVVVELPAAEPALAPVGV